MIKIIRQTRKSISVSIDESLQVVVKAPPWVSEQEITELINKKKATIVQIREQKKKELYAKTWFERKKLLFLGGYKNIIIRKEPCLEITQIRVEEDNLIITTSEEDNQMIKVMIQKWCKDYLKKILEMYTREYAEVIKCRYNHITVRDQKTRWGSCSSKGNLSYNMKLICAPLEVIQYVVLHEVMHLKYFDHSSQFWQGIEVLMPDFKLRKTYLKAHGSKFEI